MGGIGEKKRVPRLVAVRKAPARRERRNLHPPAYQPLSLELLRTTDTFIAGVVLVAVFVGVNATNLSYAGADFLLLRVSVKNLLLLCGFVALWQLLFTMARLYSLSVIRDRRREMKRVFVASAIGSVAVLVISLIEVSSAFPPQAALYYLGAVVLATGSVRTVIREVSVRAQNWAVKEIIIVGSGPRAYKLLRDMQSAPGSNYQLAGFVDSNDEIELKDIRDRLIGRLDELEEILMRRPIDEVLIALPIRSCYAEIEEVIRTCERVGVESKYFADVFENAFARARYDSNGGSPAVSLRVVHDGPLLIVKRMFDVVAGIIAVVLLAPVMLAVAVGIKLTSPGPIIFSQWRYGRNRRLFRMYKFRTMVVDAEDLQNTVEHLNEVGGPVFKIANDPRITRFGRFLRRTSLDELPQFYNVLRGEMSFVGPRPLPTRDVNRFNEGRLMRRFSVVPGLTCLWQISGRNQVDFDEWLRLDLEYIDRWSLLLDFLILVRTVPAVIRGTGAQ
jgi:exopolysaccharide biosynthesis polyprenyl glycosylphosphotransferase